MQDELIEAMARVVELEALGRIEAQAVCVALPASPDPEYDPADHDD